MKKAILFILVLLIVNLAACTKGNKIPEDDAIKAPVIRLSDSLSSQLNEFTVQSGNYSLKYMVDKEMRGVTACGSHPLDKSQEKMKNSGYRNTMAWIIRHICWPAIENQTG